MDGDEVALVVEAVDLDEPVFVGGRAVEDEEGEVVVAVDLGPLAELLRVLDRQRMEVEDVAQNPEVVASGWSRSSQKKPPSARSASIFSRLNSTGPVPEWWMTWQERAPVLPLAPLLSRSTV